MTNEQVEKEEIQNAIKEIRFLIQVLQDTPLTSPISRELKKKYIGGLFQEEQDYIEYLNSIFTEEEFEKKLDNLIDCEIEASKIRRSEEQENGN